MGISKKPTFYRYDNGHIMSGNQPRKSFYETLKYVPTEEDIFICTYPKCGTTWTQNILYLMGHKGVPLQPHQSLKSFIPQIEWDGVDEVLSIPGPRVIKTHLNHNLVPKSENAKYIYVARNPKDCCVSFYNHAKGFPKFYDFEDGTFEDFFEVFMQGEVSFNDYFDHLLSYYKRRHDPNMLFLLYEEMKQDIEGCVRKIGSFLGGEFQQACEDPKILRDIIRHSSLKAMQSTPTIWSSARSENGTAFIRKGVVGDWRSVFTDEQSRIMDEKFENVLEGSGAEYLWDEYDCLEAY